MRLRDFTTYLFNESRLFDFKYVTINNVTENYHLENKLMFPVKDYRLVLSTEHIRERYDIELNRRHISEHEDFDKDNGNALDTALIDLEEEIAPYFD